MLLRMEGKLGEHHSVSGGQLHREAAEARAGRIVAEELKRRGWGAVELERRRKNDPEKLAIAARLRRETTLWLKEMVRRVRLGSSKGANATLHRHMRCNDASAGQE